VTKNERDGVGPWVDPDDAPELTDAHFEHAHIYVGDTVVRRARGRPPIANPKRQLTIRLDPDLIERLRATGPGWQTRLNEAVRDWLQRASA